MNEKLLSFIWFNRLYNANILVTTKGEKIDVIKHGFENHNSGPDITEAQIRISNIVWVGNIELHVKSSNWVKHHHHTDLAYSNIILHIVFEDDKPLIDQYGNLVPTLVLPFDNKYITIYQKLINNFNPDVCKCGFKSFGSLKTSCFIDRLSTERLKDKSLSILEAFNRNNGNWTETFWQFLARAFGFGKNAVPFQMLAQSVQFKLLQRNRHAFDIVLAILYGQAGFFSLNRFNKPEYQKIKEFYQYQQLKYNLKPIEPSMWKFSGMRPVNFPDRRIQQLALLIIQNGNLFSTITDSQNIETLQSIFLINKAIIHSNNLSNLDIQPLGNDTINLLLINLVVPFLYAYATYNKNENLAQISVSLLENLAPENNSIVVKMAKQAMQPLSAFESQALLQLYNCYCKPKRCIECQIGRYIVKNVAL